MQHFAMIQWVLVGCDGECSLITLPVFDKALEIFGTSLGVDKSVISYRFILASISRTLINPLSTPTV